jgi:hypothetical protein
MNTQHIAHKENEMKKYQDSALVRDCRIRLEITDTKQGIQGLLIGGELPHIGAVTVISPEGKATSIVFQGHKEGELADWCAEKLYGFFDQPVVMSCGIHYDNITGEEIARVVSESCRMLEHFLAQQEGRSCENEVGQVE